MELALDRQKFSEKKVLIGLLAVQIPLLLVALILPPQTTLLVGVGLGGIILFSILLPVYPQIIFPLMIVVSALDLGGHLIEDIGFFGNFSVPLTWFHLAGGAAIIFCAVNVLFKKRTLFPRIEVTLPLTLFLILYGISISYSPDKLEATVMFFRHLALAALIFITPYVVESKRAVTLVLASLIIWQVALSVWGIVQTLTAQYFLEAAFVNMVGATTPRATGAFHNPNDFATLLMVGIVLTAALFANLRVAFWKRSVLLLVIVALSAGLVTSFSRSNWLATVIGLLCVALLSRKLRLLLVVSLVLSIIVFTITMISSNFAELVAGRFTSIFKTVTEFQSATNVSGTARVQLVQASLAMFADHPFFGVGGRGFPIAFDKYKPINYPTWIPVRENHTLPALILAELGIIGFVFFVWFVITVIQAGVRGVRTIEDRYLKAVEIGLLAVFVGYQVSMLFTAAFEDNYFWLSTGLLLAVKRIGETQAGEREGRGAREIPSASPHVV